MKELTFKTLKTLPPSKLFTKRFEYNDEKREQEINIASNYLMSKTHKWNIMKKLNIKYWTSLSLSSSNNKSIKIRELIINKLSGEQAFLNDIFNPNNFPNEVMEV